MGKKPKPETFEPYDWDLPSLIVDELLDRTTPHTEEELDLLAEGMLEVIRDTASSKNLVDRAGEEEARRASGTAEHQRSGDPGRHLDSCKSVDCCLFLPLLPDFEIDYFPHAIPVRLRGRCVCI